MTFHSTLCELTNHLWKGQHTKSYTILSVLFLTERSITRLDTPVLRLLNQQVESWGQGCRKQEEEPSRTWSPDNTCTESFFSFYFTFDSLALQSRVESENPQNRKTLITKRVTYKTGSHQASLSAQKAALSPTASSTFLWISLTTVDSQWKHHAN